MSGLAFAPTPTSSGDESTVLAVAERTARVVGVAWDPAASRSAFQAWIPGQADPLPEWAQPMGEVFRSLGMRVRSWTGTAAEAYRRARADLPMLGVVAGADGTPTWILVGGRRFLGGVAAWEPDEDDVQLRLSRAEFLRRFSANGADLPRLWLLPEPVAPAADLLGPGGSNYGPFRRLLYLLSAERGDMGVVLVYAIGIGVLGLATPVIVQVLVNTVAFASLTLPIVVLTVLLLVALTFSAILRSLKRYAVEMLQRRIFVKMAMDLAWRLPRVRAAAFDEVYGPSFVNRFFDTMTVQKAASSLLIDGLSAGIQAIVGLVLLAVYHPALLGFDLFLLGSMFLVIWGLGIGGPKSAMKESKAKYAVASWLEEVAAHPVLFKLPGGEVLARQRLDDLAHSYLDYREAHFKVFFRQYMGTLGLQVVAATGLLGLGGWLVLEGQLSLGQLVAAELVVASILAAFSKFSEKLDVFYDLIAGVDKLGSLVDLPLEGESGGSLPVSGGPIGLSLQQVGFSFPGGGDPVLSGVDLELRPGEKVAIVGDDGAGKSVLADIVYGLRQPTVGRILVDTSDLRELRPQAVRRFAALCRGEEVVSGSLAENIALGRTEIERSDLREVLDQVGLTPVIERLSEGLDTELAPTGAPLSNTQIMRLMLARAMVGRPRLLVVDHTLDALSAQARGPLLDALMAPDAPWTLILLTQDPTLLDAFPRRYRLSRGILTSAEGRFRTLEVR
jgi:ABC-type bacteriocin/lantibiotic exporter with double-glycine peptidase domain